MNKEFDWEEFIKEINELECKYKMSVEEVYLEKNEYHKLVNLIQISNLIYEEMPHFDKEIRLVIGITVRMLNNE
jgi:hypothetical protein